MGDPTPTQLGGYLVLRHLATGGMAEVLLARSVADASKHVVIKRIRGDQARDAQFVQMFLDEARIAAYLQHPNIVQVFDTGEERGEYFFAMEYVHGEDLRKVLMEVHKRKDQLPIAMVTGVVAGAAAGLHHAHKQLGPDFKPLGIVHRDVSPANILVGYDGSVKVVDFGIAKAALRTVETRSGTLKGKVSYMSPEQVAGKSIDRRSDVFALGVVLYEVATARRLFKGDNDFLTMSAIVQGDIPRPTMYRADLPRVLEDIIMTALASAPADRFQSAEELRTALAQFTESLGMRMSQGSIADYMKKMFGSRAAPWLAGDDEVTETTSIDFDGSESGVVQAPDAAVSGNKLPSTLRPGASAPILYAQSDVTGTPVPPRDAGWAEISSSGSAERMAWLSEPTPIRHRSPRRMFGVAIGVAAVAAVGTFIVVSLNRAGPDAKAEPATIQMTATPPPDRPPVQPVASVAEPPPPPPSPAAPATSPAKHPAVAVKPNVAVPKPPPSKPPAVALKPEVAAPKPPPSKPPAVALKSEVAAPKPPPPKPPPAMKTAPKPPTIVVKADKPRPPRPVPPPPKKPAAGSNWDPNALFAPK